MSTLIKKVRIDAEIKAHHVYLIDVKGKPIGEVTIDDARQAVIDAKESEQDDKLNLVEISSGQNSDGKLSVCRIMNYGKYKYTLEKKKASQRKKQKQVQVKEIKLRPGTEEGDFQVKLRNIVRFLEAGNKVKVTIRFRGREVVHKELGEELMRRIEKSVEAFAVAEQQPRLEGRQMIMIIGPKKK